MGTSAKAVKLKEYVSEREKNMEFTELVDVFWQFVFTYLKRVISSDW